MRVFRSLAEVPRVFGPSVVAIGNFDGVHAGHLRILEEVKARALAQGAQSVAVLFEPHPLRVLRPEFAPKLITPLAERVRLLAATGIDAALVLPFTHDFARLPARDFVDTVLRQALGAVEVHEGDNFRFGYEARAGVAELRELGREMGFAVVVHPVITIGRLRVSSSAVRERVAEGDMRSARIMLGRPFSVVSTPAAGRGIGSKLTVPTINLAGYGELLPANGVYATRVALEGECFDAVTNAGNRPTFGEDSFAIESHMLDFKPMDLTVETRAEVVFFKRLRDERRFASPEALREQILLDVAWARRYFHLMMKLVVD